MGGTLGAVAEETSFHLDRGYDSNLTRERLEELGLGWEISGKGRPAPFWASFSDVVIIVRKLIREGWSRYRWEGWRSQRP
jgi:hypothetical protein